MSVKLPYVKPGSVWKANGETGFVKEKRYDTFGENVTTRG